MLRNISRVRLVGAWCVLMLAIAAAFVVAGAAITVANVGLLFAACVAPPVVMLLVWGGMQLGDHWLELKQSLKGLDYLVAAAIVAAVGIFVWRHVRR